MNLCQTISSGRPLINEEIKLNVLLAIVQCPKESTSKLAPEQNVSRKPSKIQMLHTMYTVY